MERFERRRRRPAEADLTTDPQIDWRVRDDGKAHTLVRGTHFTRPAAKVRRAAGMWASRNERRAVTRIEDGGTKLVVTFVPRTGKV